MKYKGFTAHPGQATGRARVISKPEDVASIEFGDILVCPMTTPEWMPAFGKVAAIVTQNGGTVCHAAIVARAYGKPCIVAAQGVMDIKDGDQITVVAKGGTDATVLWGEKSESFSKQDLREMSTGMMGGHRMSLAERERYS